MHNLLEDGLAELQHFMRKRPLIIVGTGLSLSMGLPGMAELLDHLQVRIPQLCDSAPGLAEEWERCAGLIRLYGFEEGLGKTTVSDPLLKLIVEETAILVGTRDLDTLRRLPSLLPSDFPFARLLDHLFRSLPPDNPILNIITPNYDHLVEYACDLLGIECVTGFSGKMMKRFHYHLLKEDTYKRYLTSDKRPKAEHRKAAKIRLLKPHGSLYWQRVGDDIFESFEPIPHSSRVIITPGLTKYRNSLTDTIMNYHRELANECIANAESVLVIGYGFNDSHLQTVLGERLRTGMPCLILTRSLSGKGLELIRSFHQMIALEAASGTTRTRWHFNGEQGIWEEPLWSLDHFVKRVIG
jgi:hypothetical protein